MLKHLGYDSFPLPSMEEVINIKNELLSIHPADITAKLAWDDYKCKERFIRDSFNGFLEIDGCGDAVRIDNEVYLYWDGLTKKLIKRTEGMEEVTAQKYIDDYSTLIWEISCAIHDTTRGMKADLNYLFNDEVESEDSTEEWRLPDVFNTPEAKGYFSQLIDLKFMEIDTNGVYIWRGTKMELALVANLMSERLNISNKWQIFEGVFREKNLAQANYKAKEIYGRFSKRENNIKDIFKE